MFTIHGIPISVHTRKVIVAALEKRLDFESQPVIPFDPPTGWRRLSPTGRIPVVTYGALIVRDSAAICAWLERIHEEPRLYPQSPADYARALWLESYAGEVLFRDVVQGLFVQQIVRPQMLREQCDASVVERILTTAVPQAFGYLEESLDGSFLAGEAFSIGDISVVSNLINFHYLGHGIDSRYARLRAYFDAQLRRPSIAAALDREAQFANGMGLKRDFARNAH
jgi:glutathione S-transferase